MYMFSVSNIPPLRAVLLRLERQRPSFCLRHVTQWAFVSCRVIVLLGCMLSVTLDVSSKDNQHTQIVAEAVI